MGWYGRLEQDGLGIGVGMIFYPFFFFFRFWPVVPMIRPDCDFGLQCLRFPVTRGGERRQWVRANKLRRAVDCVMSFST